MADDLSGRELDRLAGLTEGHVSLIEAGTAGTANGIKTRTASALASVLGVSLDWLIDGDGDDPSVEAVRASVSDARAKNDAA